MREPASTSTKAGKAPKWTENILSLPAHPVFQGPVPDGWKPNGHGAYESLSRLLGFNDKALDDTQASPGENSFVMHGPGYVSLPPPSSRPGGLPWAAVHVKLLKRTRRIRG